MHALVDLPNPEFCPIDIIIIKICGNISHNATNKYHNKHTKIILFICFLEKNIINEIEIIKRGASFRLPFGPNSACGSKDTSTISMIHPTLVNLLDDVLKSEKNFLHFDDIFKIFRFRMEKFLNIAWFFVFRFRNTKNNKN